jgi:low affinity Fe/Cu permease
MQFLRRKASIPVSPRIQSQALRYGGVCLRNQSNRPRRGVANDWFGRFAAHSANWLGSRWGFAGAAAIILIWATTGPLFHFSNTWQLVINTGTTIVTFLMVFLIQNTQNRDARAINLKLDELIRAVGDARNNMIDIERLSDAELDHLHSRYEKINIARIARIKPKHEKG